MHPFLTKKKKKTEYWEKTIVLNPSLPLIFHWLLRFVFKNVSMTQEYLFLCVL